MTDRCLKLVVQKTMTKERERISGLTSDEALEGLRYALFDIFGLKQEEIPKILSIDFMRRYDIYRYYRLIQPPETFKFAKFKFVLSKLCPDVIDFDSKTEIWNRFLLTIKDKTRPSFWKEFSDIPSTFIVIRKLLVSVFLIDDLSDLFDVCDNHPDILLDTIKIFRLDDFYETFCMCLPDFVWGSFTDYEKKKYMLPYLSSRLKCEEGKELVIKMMEENKDKIKEWADDKSVCVV